MNSVVKILLAIVGVVVVGLGALAVWLYTPDKPLAELEAQYLRGLDDYRDVAGLRMHVRVEGEGPAILLIHGFGSSLHTWDAWAQDLSRDHTVIRFDLPGHGLTGPDPTGDYSIDRSVVVIRELLDTLGVDRATVAGNSLGGQLAFTFAGTYPERVENLVLISPGVFPVPGYEYGQVAEIPAAFRIMPFTLKEAAVTRAITAFYGDPGRIEPGTVERYHDMMLAPGIREALVARLSQYKLEDPAPTMARITAPTLILWGERDLLIPVTDAEKVKALLPRSDLIVYPEVGHMAMEEVPERTLADLRAFLSRRTAG